MTWSRFRSKGLARCETRCILRVDSFRCSPAFGRIAVAGGHPPMKIFLDTANLDEIRQGTSLGVLDGVPTTPSLVAKEMWPFRGPARRRFGRRPTACPRDRRDPS